MKWQPGRFDAEQVRVIRAAYEAAKPGRKRWRKRLARQLGAKPKHLSDIAQRRLYRWVP